MPTPTPTPTPTSADVRAQIREALRLDLVGPRPGEPSHEGFRDEILPSAPSKYYLTGFLVPFEAPPEQRSDADKDDELDVVNKPREADDDETPERASARKAFFPSSVGLSVLIPKGAREMRVELGWGEYIGTKRDEGGIWSRCENVSTSTISLVDVHRETIAVAGHHDGKYGVEMVVTVRPVADTGLVPPGTRSASVFLVNNRKLIG